MSTAYVRGLLLLNPNIRRFPQIIKKLLQLQLRGRHRQSLRDQWVHHLPLRLHTYLEAPGTGPAAGLKRRPNKAYPLPRLKEERRLVLVVIQPPEARFRGVLPSLLLLPSLTSASISAQTACPWRKASILIPTPA